MAKKAKNDDRRFTFTSEHINEKHPRYSTPMLHMEKQGGEDNSRTHWMYLFDFVQDFCAQAAIDINRGLLGFKEFYDDNDPEDRLRREDFNFNWLIESGLKGSALQGKIQNLFLKASTQITQKIMHEDRLDPSFPTWAWDHRSDFRENFGTDLRRAVMPWFTSLAYDLVKQARFDEVEFDVSALVARIKSESPHLQFSFKGSDPVKIGKYRVGKNSKGVSMFMSNQKPIDMNRAGYVMLKYEGNRSNRLSHNLTFCPFIEVQALKFINELERVSLSYSGEHGLKVNFFPSSKYMGEFNTLRAKTELEQDSLDEYGWERIQDDGSCKPGKRKSPLEAVNSRDRGHEEALAFRKEIKRLKENRDEWKSKYLSLKKLYNRVKDKFQKASAFWESL